MFCGKAHSLKPELHSEIEEVDARFIPHVKVAVLDGSAKIVVLSTDTDPLMLFVHYLESFSGQAIEVRNLFGASSQFVSFSTICKFGFYKFWMGTRK